MKPLIDSLPFRYPPYGLWRWLIAGVLALVMAAWLARDGVTLTAFPATAVLDSFDRANGGLGASWSGSSGGYSVAGNLLSVGSGGDVYWRGTAFGADQEVFITFSTLKATAEEQDLLLKSQSSTSYGSGVIEVWYDAVGKRVQVWTYAGSQGWVQRGADLPVAFVSGDQFGARALATGQVEVYRNGTLVGARDASAWPFNAGGGHIGLWFISGAGATFDSFGGGTIATTGPAATLTVPPPPTFTAPAQPPTATLLPLTATGLPPTATRPPSTTTSLPPTATPLSASTAVPAEGPIYMPVGPGFSDVIARQIVRTGDDRLYIFAPRTYSTQLRAYWASAPGLPTAATTFSFAQVSDTSHLLSAEAVYDGGGFVHVLVNTNAGVLKDYVFDLAQNTFRPALPLSTGNPTVSGDYIGTAGVSGMVDLAGRLQVAYWSNANHITHQAYTYDALAHALTPVGTPVQVDLAGSASHPVVAVSPADGALTVAWVSEAAAPARILTRTRTANGVWSAVQTVSTAPVWTSLYFGVNIDQGPSLVIDPAGVKHLVYIENYDATNDYGRAHYAADAGSGWVDQALPIYTHDPALALTSTGDLYVIGHGHPNNALYQSANPTCRSMDEMCVLKRQANGTWGASQLFAPKPGAESFDGSPSVKWSVVGFNRPDTLEFAFFSTPYLDPTLYYGRLMPVAAGVTATPVPAATNTATPTATRTFTPVPPAVTAAFTPLPSLIFADGFETGTLSAWSASATNGGNLVVTTTAALVGGRGMQVRIVNNTAMYLTDDRPAAEARYRARFYFDPNTIAMSNGNAHYIFYGYTTGNTTVVLRLEFRFSTPNYQLRAALLTDAGSWRTGAWVTLSDAPQVVEFDWRAATAVGANNGGLTLWLDGTQVTALTGVDNDTRRLERIRLGPVAGLDTGTRGAYFLDAFEARRLTYIGP